MKGWLVPLLAGAATGVLSGYGVGGGSLLLVWMTAFAGVDQRLAQGINLLYFLPTAAAALPAHFKNGQVEKAVLRPAILAGLVSAALGAWAASAIDPALLKKCFGVFLLIIGAKELLQKERPGP